MLKQKLNTEQSKSICEIDTRLAELEEEKKQLLDLRKQLQKSSAIAPEASSYSPEQKIAIFRNLFRGRTDIFASRWVNKQGRSGYSVACIMSGYRESATSRALNARIVIIDNSRNLRIRQFTDT